MGSGFDERGFAANLAWGPRPESDHGLSLIVGHSLGASASGGMDALFSANTLNGPAPTHDSENAIPHRLDARLGSGLPAFDGRFTFMPELT